jgi:hypothetical protein
VKTVARRKGNTLGCILATNQAHALFVYYVLHSGAASGAGPFFLLPPVVNEIADLPRNLK